MTQMGHVCQSAFKIDPSSASNFDPFGRRALAGCLILIAALEAPTVVSGLDDVAMVGEPIEQCGGHLGVAEDAMPFAEGQVGDYDDRCAFVELADEVEQQLSPDWANGR